jgi:hypothetical protein
MSQRDKLLVKILLETADANRILSPCVNYYVILSLKNVFEAVITFSPKQESKKS